MTCPRPARLITSHWRHVTLAFYADIFSLPPAASDSHPPRHPSTASKSAFPCWIPETRHVPADLDPAIADSADAPPAEHTGPIAAGPHGPPPDLRVVRPPVYRAKIIVPGRATRIRVPHTLVPAPVLRDPRSPETQRAGSLMTPNLTNPAPFLRPRRLFRHPLPQRPLRGTPRHTRATA